MLAVMEAKSHSPRRASASSVGLALIALACAPLLSCRQAEDPPQTPSTQPSAPQHPGALQMQQTTPAPPAGAQSEPAFAPHRGRCVIVEGYASGQKIGPLLQGGAWAIGVSLKDPRGDAAWWALPGGSRVRVRGVVTERSDLPVFIQKKGEPIMQGMPVPEGTDLDEARRRYVLDQASVTQARSVAQAESDLKAAVGKDVSLSGVIWSLNDHWWFNHDGVEIHVEGQEKISGWSSMHGLPATLSGRLDRRPLPRIDQIALKPDRDLADAFLLSLRGMAAHPSTPVTSCPSDD
jgi:hypothetical protein